jgi:hypothetical protein
MRLARCLVLLSLLGCMTYAAGGTPAPTPVPSGTPSAFAQVLLPCGIADPAGRTGYLANAHGGIEAVDLKTGDLLWESNEAQRPLLIIGSRLLAQAGTRRNRFRVLAFDLAQRGECVLESDPVVLPAWVVTGEAPGHSFEARWRVEHNHLVVAWEATAWYPGPGRPTKQQAEAARRRGAGTARIDLDNGQVETGPPEPPPAAPPGPPPEALEKKSLRWQGTCAGRAYALVLDESSREQVLVLRSWDPATGREGAARELLHGKRLLAQATLDGRLLCLRQGVAPPDDKGARPITRDDFWVLFSLELGVPLARLTYEPGTQGIAVLGTRAYYAVAGSVRGPLDRTLIAPRVLKAVDLRTDKTLWERPVAGRPVAPPVR